MKTLIARNKYLLTIIGIVFGIVLVSACSKAVSINLPNVDDYLRSKFNALGPVPVPVENQMSEDKVKLGKMLFFDERLSGNNKLSCVSCHATDKAFTDGREIAIGVDGRKGIRNSPTVINSAYYEKLFWDGRASSFRGAGIETDSKSG